MEISDDCDNIWPKNWEVAANQTAPKSNSVQFMGKTKKKGKSEFSLNSGELFHVTVTNRTGRELYAKSDVCLIIYVPVPLLMLK